MHFNLRFRVSAAAFGIVTAAATALVLTTGPTVARAAVWTDQSDYSPGSVVTFNGDNSDGAGYAAGETVQVAVNGPGGINQSCDATADGSGAWSCQITLDSSAAAVGSYSYTATGQTSGVSQSGAFADSGCPEAKNVGTRPTDPSLQASFTTSGSTATYTVTTPSVTPSSTGVPGLIEYCVYTGGNPLPTSVSASYDHWTAGTDTAFFDFQRPGGDDTNIPFDGSTKTVGTATWSGSVPSSQLILLHINDQNECINLYGAGASATCFVLPGTAPSNQDLQVTKTAVPSFTRTFNWNISKNVDQTQIDIAQGGSATFNYTVGVTHDGGTDGSWQVTGTITVTNPNSADFNGVNVTDAIDNGGTCAVTGGTSATIPANGSSDFAYTCTYSSAPTSATGTDTATATWDQTAYGTPDGSASGMATAAFTTPTKIVDGSVDVTDTLGGDLGTVSYTDASPTNFTYSHTFTGDPAGTCTSHDNTATFTTSDSHTTGSASQTVGVCVGADLTVTKTAAPSFIRTFTWGITKSVDHSVVDTSGPATVSYTVEVTHDGGTDSKWQVNGNITVTNPNDWEAVTANVADAIDNGGSCTVSGGTNVKVPKSGSVTLPYTCTYTSAPSPAGFTNTATASWDPSLFFTPGSSASGTATGAFGDPTTIVDGSVTVTDTLKGPLGTVSYTDASPKDFTYPLTFNDPAGTCTFHTNTATFTTGDTGTTGSAGQTVQVCVGADLTVTKTAQTAFTRTYNWNITKKVTPALIEQTGGGTASAGYTVTVTQTGFTDSGWQVSGTITVTNPNDWEAVTANVADAIDNNGNCTVNGGTTSVTVSKSSSVNLPYTCTYSSAPAPSAGTNTGTATWSSSAAFTPHGSASGTAGYAFGAPTSLINQKITPVDQFNGGTKTQLCTLASGTPCTLTATDAKPFTSQTYTYSRTLNVPTSNCVTFPNTASTGLTGTGQSASASVEACGPARTGALTMGYWQNKNGQAIITGGASTGGVCNSGAWLRQYAPFQDLSATASCSAVATYVSTLIKAANASGASMNAMLKAQMLATALDVYFSTPSLGGNKIGAPAPIGGVSIDLTKVCAMLDSSNGTASCSGSYENVSSAFGGATPLTVSQMLAYAASQSNSGGTTWYGQVKATQGLAKDAFDAINNQAVFSP